MGRNITLYERIDYRLNEMTEILELLFIILGTTFICFIVRLFMIEFLSIDITHINDVDMTEINKKMTEIDK